jgi:hypothetical protein
MGTIYYDGRSGTLLEGKIWAWVAPDVSEIKCAYADEIVADSKLRELHECPIDRRHTTGSVFEEIRIDLFGYEVADFVPEMGNEMVSKRFADRLKTSTLTGYRLEPIVHVKVNQSSTKNPELLHLEFAGKGGFNRRLKVRDGKNLCPFCGREPVICPGCGEVQRECLNCGKQTLYLPAAVSGFKDKRGFRLEGSSADTCVVEGREWDGSDFFTCGGIPFISDRAKDWLERIHAHPFQVEEALLNVA